MAWLKGGGGNWDQMGGLKATNWSNISERKSAITFIHDLPFDSPLIINVLKHTPGYLLSAAGLIQG